MFWFKGKLKRAKSRIPIINAIIEDDVLQVESLLRKGESPNEISRDKSSPLCEACSRQNLRAVELLIQYGADVNLYIKKGISCLSAAAASGNYEIVNLLLKNGADANGLDSRGRSSGWSPLQYAVFHGENVDVVNLLLNSGASTRRLEEEFQTIFFRVPGDILRLLKSKSVNFSPEIENMLEGHYARGDDNAAS